VQKAACIQAMHERDVLIRSPMLAPIDPARLTPLIRGLPDSLKTYVANIQDRLQVACPTQGRRPRRRQDQDQDQAQNQVITWSEFVQDIVN